tara:strand:+ start:2225 stop:3526 length:1302 start_codon:yes stop_codon:yes gene_type:complete
MIIKNIIYKNNNFFNQLKRFLEKRKFDQNQNSLIVKKIINDVRKNEDKAVLKYEKKFNKNPKIKIGDFKYSNNEINKFIKKLDYRTKKSIDISYRRIKKFHSMQMMKTFSFKDSLNIKLSYKSSPIDRVGVYVPGGTANYPSTVLMNCIPAIVAGVKKMYLTTPSDRKNINPAVIYAAVKCGVKEIYSIGGAQAIAAFAFGTKKINKVDKIVGPGNLFVSAAKKEVYGDVGIDMIAGPSEVLVVADKYSNPDWIAADLIAQAEHDRFAQSILLCNDKKIILDVNKKLKTQLKNLPKKRIALSSLKKFGCSLLVKNINNFSKVINEIAPEHLQIDLKKPERIIKKIKNAGSIFIGKYSPEAMGDYLAGPNHVLPTSGSAKFSSGLSVYDFLKRHSFIKISKSGIERLGPLVINLAKYEKLEGHANSIKIRIKRN